ncbi:unnamed protein product [Allacma fusca]|uniref:Major facilitator superfamily (MFS) profile domain-containing protein n=1 Tax=Allacma fusca TaxID=39272 RepID=A0A8J2PT45_9HEXA|nr:unnamed protein product [Allacma fusca]
MPDGVHNIEDVFHKIGGFGRFQLFALLTIIYPEMPAAVLAMTPVFVGGIPKSWNCTEDINGSSITSQLNSKDVCSCNGTLYGGEDSIVSEWNLVCDYSWVSDFITSIQMGGMFIGALLGSQLADWIGRKQTLYLSCLLMLLGGAASSISPSPYVFAAARFLIGVNISTYMVMATIYPMEFFTPKYRSLSGTLGPWGEGVILLALLAYFFPSWRTLSWVTCLPMTLIFFTFPFMPESPRWLLQQGRVTEAKKVFDQISQWNGYEKVDNSTVEALAADLERQKKESTGQNRTAYLKIILNGKSLSKVMIFMGIWFSCSFIFYGVSFGAKSLSGDVYLNMVYVGIIDTLALPSSVLLMGWPLASTILMDSNISVPLVGIILMEMELGIPHSSTVKVILALTSRIFVDGGWTTIKCFTGESFPTSIRSSAVGICTVGVAIAGVVAPQVVFLGTMYPAAPYFIFGGFSVASAGLSFLLRETQGNPIEETEAVK